MAIGEEFNVLGSWFRIHFIENEGMAFGIRIWGDYGKLILSLFRLIASVFIAFYLRTLIKNKASYGLLAAISLIFSGAVGNIIDSAFYGLIFTESGYFMHGSGQPAELVGLGHGYGSFLHGRVVDMFYFPIYDGENFKFFQAIFNIADAAISIGVGMIILFYRRFFGQDKKPVQPEQEPVIMGTVPFDGGDKTPENTEHIANDNTEQKQADVSDTHQDENPKDEK